MGQVIFEVPGPGQYTVTADPSLPALENPGNAAEVLDGQQFYQADNTPVTGTMPNNGAVNETLAAGGSYTIPAGYHNGSGKVSAEPMSAQTPGTAQADDILSGETAWVNGTQITGSMPNNNGVSQSLAAGEEYTIPQGYHNGSGKVTADSLSGQTPGTADAGDIVQGETAWVNGQQITGTLVPGSITTDATATASQILAPYTAYVASGKVTGTIPTNDDADVTINGAQVSVAAGYFAQAVSKAIPTVAQAVPSISVSDAGLITATATQNAGYVAQGTQSATQQLTVQGAQTITPGTAVQTIAAGRYLTGAQTIQGDANLTAGNIKDGVSIFGVQGTYEGASGFTSVPLVVTVTSGATVTAQHDNTVLTAVSKGTATFELTIPGEWTISAELNGEVTSTETITVYDSYAVSLQFVPQRIQSLGLSVARYNLAAVSIGAYALFGGGGPTSDVVDAFDLSLTLSQATPLSVARRQLSATNVGNYALFGGGLASSRVDTVDAYDESLTRSSPSNLSQAVNVLSATRIGDFALFAGGLVNVDGTIYTYSDVVDAYSSSLTKTIADPLIRARGNFASTSNGQYAVFAGGADARLSCSDVVDAYDDTLTKSIPEALSTELSDLAATSVGEYMLFAGGQYRYGSTYDPTNAVTVYDSTLTKTRADNLNTERCFLSATTLNGYAIFAGGQDGGLTMNDAKSTTDAYSTTLTHVRPDNLSTARTNLAAATLDGYALFGGGGIGQNGGVSNAIYVVDIYAM